MKRVIKLLMTAAISITALCGMTPVPESVETQSDGGKAEIVKVYRLSAEEDPSLLIEEPFEQNGFLYQYEYMTKEEERSEQKKIARQEVTLETDTDDLEMILQQIEGSISYQGEDGYIGELTLEPASIRTEAAGYATSSYTVSDTRSYTDLPYNDPSLVPQTVQKNGLTLTLSGITWKGQGGTGANGSLIPTSYTATASYSGVGSRRYATGYLTTASYSGEVTLTTTEPVYTLTYGGNPIPEPEEIQTEEGPDWIALSIMGIGGAAVLLLLVSTLFYRSKRRKRGDEHEM